MTAGTSAPGTLAVLGAGSWGTALASLAARNGLATTLWGRDAAVIEAIDRQHQNPRYLPGIDLPGTLRATTDQAAAVSGWYFAHPEAQYFAVQKIARDQLEDWAQRKGISADEAARWLAPIL